MANVKVYGGKARSTSTPGSPLLAAILTGVAAIVAWVVLVSVVHDDVGAAAWGVGALMGLVVAKTAKPPSKTTGTQAAIVTFVTVIVAKFLLVTIALQPALRDLAFKDDDMIAQFYMIEMLRDTNFSPTLTAEIKARPALLRDTSFFGAGYEIRERMFEEAEARARAASPSERERLLRAHLDNTLVEKVGFWVLLITTVLPLDLLWFGLGVSTAWKLGQGIG